MRTTPHNRQPYRPGAHGLECKRAQHQFAPAHAGDVFGNDHVRGRVIASQREPEAEQADDQRNKTVAEDGGAKERSEDDHLHDEHGFAPEPVRQATQADGADQDSAQAGGADESVLRRRDVELSRDERQRNTGHEHHKPLEELACGGQHPDTPLHRRHGIGLQPRTIGPHRQFVYIVLHTSGRGRHRVCIRHCDLLLRMVQHAPTGFWRSVIHSARGWMSATQ